MLKCILFLLISYPVFSNAQQSLTAENSALKQVVQHECDKVFTKSEQIASIKISNAEFEDTLTSLLKLKKAFHKTDKVVFRFILTTQSKMTDLTLESGEIRKEDRVKESIQALADLWLPAIQNGRAVCSYVSLEMIIQRDKLDIRIFQ